MSAWKPTDEQTRAVSDWFGADVGYTEHFTLSPAFQSIIRAAQADAWEQGWDANEDEQYCPVAEVANCGECISCVPANPYRSEAIS